MKLDSVTTTAPQCTATFVVTGEITCAGGEVRIRRCGRWNQDSRVDFDKNYYGTCLFVIHTTRGKAKYSRLILGWR